MRQIPLLAGTMAASVLALALSSGVCAQQTEPVAAASTPSHTDNTAVNKRDRSSQTLTPADQPNDRTDVKLAAAVRRAIVKDDSLSASAHNVKLIVANGVVTLRGPVNTADEKGRIETIARRITGVTRVDNELDVKTP